jgi:hypothetical protein
LPGLPRPIVKQCINDAYQDLYRKWQWAAFEQSFTLPLSSEYTTGHVGISIGSRVVTGVSTVWTSAMVGRNIRLNGEDEYYKVGSIASTTSLLLDRNYVGDGSTNLTAKDYSIFQNVYTLNSQVREILNMSCSDRLTERPTEFFDRSDPTRTSFGEPQYFSSLGRTSSGVKVELWPVPDTTYVLRYRARVAPLSLSDNDDSLLLDDQLVEIMAWLRAFPKAVRLMKDPTLKEMYPIKKDLADELYNDAMIEDTRLHSTFPTAQDRTSGSSYYDSNEFRIDHDVD